MVYFQGNYEIFTKNIGNNRPFIIGLIIIIGIGCFNNRVYTVSV